jgi:hypothetical protein
MQSIPEGTTIDQIRTGVVTEVERVEADDDVAQLAAPYRAVVDAFVALHAQLDPLELAWIRADARLRAIDRRLDSVVKGLRLEIISLSGNTLMGPLFDRFLPEGLRAVIEAEMSVIEPKKTGEIIEKLAADGGDLAAKWLQPMIAARDAVVEQAAVRLELEQQQERLQGQLATKVNELQTARDELHDLLRGRFKINPELAEEYFFSWRKGARKTTPPPAPPAA